MKQPEIYRKTAPVKAMQWDGSADDAIEVINWIMGEGGTATYQCDDEAECIENGGLAPHRIMIKTLEGIMPLEPDGWACQGIAGEFWPIKGDIFEKSYEKVSE